LVLIVAATAFFTGGWQRIIAGLTQSTHLFNKVWLRLLLGFIFGGLIQVLIPRELIAKWLGPTSGMKGILIGSYIGVFITGAPFVRMPVIASIYRAGAGIGPVMAFLAGNGLALQGVIVWQIPFLGVGISLTRYFVCLFIPPFVGLAGAAVYRLLTFSAQETEVTAQDDINITPQQDRNAQTGATSQPEEKT
jgi:uncharacterized membrane protein YraQ (UPF0718 family)